MPLSSARQPVVRRTHPNRSIHQVACNCSNQHCRTIYPLHIPSHTTTYVRVDTLLQDMILICPWLVHHSSPQTLDVSAPLRRPIVQRTGFTGREKNPGETRQGPCRTMQNRHSFHHLNGANWLKKIHIICLKPLKHISSHAIIETQSTYIYIIHTVNPDQEFPED